MALSPIVGAPTFLQRNSPLEQPRHSEEIIDQIIDVVNSISGAAGVAQPLPGGGITPIGPTGGAIIIRTVITSPIAPIGRDVPAAVNTSTNVYLTANSLVGFDGDGLTALASGDPDSIVFPLTLCLSAAGPGQEFEEISTGRHIVQVEAGISPTPGERSWLSQAQDGTVTNVRPTRRVIQAGVFASGIDDATGRAQMWLALDNVAGGRV